MTRFALLVGFAATAIAGPVKLIIDTDLGFDVDDVGAIAVGNHLQDIGLCEVIGVVHNTGFVKGIGGADVINHYYGRRNGTLELGAYRGAWGSSDDAQNAQDRYTSTIEKDFPSPIQTRDQVYDEVEAYKKILTGQDDGSVTIASIGEPLAIRNIMMAEPDLFAKKVKEIHYMDGGYNFGCGDAKGSDWSPWLGSTKDCDGAAQWVQEYIPHTIRQYFSLNGGGINTGGRFNDGCGQGPVKEAYQIWTNHGSRPSWDLISVYMSVMGPESLYSTANAGTDYVDADGNENFDTGNTGNNEFQVWIDSNHNGDVTRTLDDILCAAPCLADNITVGGCSGYSLNSGKNCYDGHGAKNLEDPPNSSAGTMTLHKCQLLCGQTTGCQGVTVSAAGGKGLVDCYRKGNINLGQCDYGNAWQYDTWTKK